MSMFLCIGIQRFLGVEKSGFLNPFVGDFGRNSSGLVISSPDFGTSSLDMSRFDENVRIRTISFNKPRVGEYIRRTI